jgi:hypothetical protein
MTWFAVDSRGEHEVHSYLTDVHVEWFTWRKEAWLAKRIRDYLRSSAGTNGKFYWGEREVKSKNLQMAWDCNQANVVDFASAFTGSGGGITPELVRAVLDDQPDDDPRIQALVLRRRLIVRYEYACGYGCAEMNSSVTRTYDSKTKRVGDVTYAWEAPRFLTPEECGIRVIGAGMYEPIKDYEPIWTDKFEKALGDVAGFVLTIATSLIEELCAALFPESAQFLCQIATEILVGLTPAGVVMDILDITALASAFLLGSGADFADTGLGAISDELKAALGDVGFTVLVVIVIAVFILLKKLGVFKAIGMGLAAFGEWLANALWLILKGLKARAGGALRGVGLREILSGLLSAIKNYFSGLAADIAGMLKKLDDAIAKIQAAIFGRPSPKPALAGAGAHGGRGVEIPQDAKVYGTEGQARRPKSKAAKKRCTSEFVACRLTTLAQYEGEGPSKIGRSGSRCEACRAKCLRTGRWPERTEGGHSCSYWEFP